MICGDLSNNKIMKNSRKQGVRVIKLLIFVNLAPLCFANIAAFVRPDNFRPIWIPELFAEHEKIIYYIFWTVYSFCSLYGSCSVLAIDFIVIYSMILVNGLTEITLEKMDDLQITLNEEIAWFFEKHEELRKYFSFQIKSNPSTYFSFQLCKINQPCIFLEYDFSCGSFIHFLWILGN